MAERKPLSKKIRFEVFKRDKFTCQYCGRMAPDVVLEIDHIKPVAKGGKNEILNLVTSCYECNRGKRDKELSDNSAVKVQQKQLLEIAARKEQLEMLLEWRESLQDLQNDFVDAVEKVFYEKTKAGFSDCGRQKISKMIKEFGLQDVLEATEIAIDTYFTGETGSPDNTFNKIGGICFNRKRQKDDPRYYYSNYIKKGCRSRFTYTNDSKIEAFVFKNIFDENDFKNAKNCLISARNWTDFGDRLEDIFGDRP